jgi:hypothetical protein
VLAKRWLLLLAFLLVSYRISYGDTEFWSADTFQFPLKEGVSFNVIPELRYRNNLNELYFIQAYLGPSFSSSKDLIFNFYYAPKTAKSANDWSSTNLLYCDAVWTGENFSDRSRFEYDLGSSILKYRNNLQFKSNSWSLGDEVFYNFKQGNIDENRLSLAYTFKSTVSISTALGGLLRSQKPAGKDWSNSNVVMLNNTIKI